MDWVAARDLRRSGLIDQLEYEGFSTEDCTEFYRTFYAPNNATLVVVGPQVQPVDDDHRLVAVRCRLRRNVHRD